LPQPPADACAHSGRLVALIKERIADAGGWISFARFMQLALHAPGLGYYSAGARKFGATGDFVTASGWGSLYGRTLARQAAQCLRAGLPEMLELGAGDGRLACDLLGELAALACLPQRYRILETSADLRERQRMLLQRELPHLADRVEWCDELPQSLQALVIANEVLDAMPAHLVKTREQGIAELGVATLNGTFVWEERPAQAAVADAARTLDLPCGYTTEINLAASGFVRTLAQRLARGVALFIDYGFPAREYYHPQRSAGTLLCHYRQHAHDDPLCLVGLQDITAHIDFSAIAGAAAASGLEVLGYTNQAQFLINCGITEVLAEIPATDTARYAPCAAQAQKLLSPAEMGELFKVLAVGQKMDEPLLGFARGDRRATL
jgi:SAM-dependent MidA family methyltransferase